MYGQKRDYSRGGSGFGSGARRGFRRLTLSLLALLLIGLSPIAPGVPAADAALITPFDQLPRPSGSDQFGKTMVQEGNILAVASDRFEDGSRVHIYRREVAGGDWSLEQTIIAVDSEPNFGRSLALSGSNLAVGSDDKVYWYTETAGVFGNPRTATSSNEDLGAAVAFDPTQGVLLVGAPLATPGSNRTGLVYRAQPDEGEGDLFLSEDPIDPDGDEGDLFGSSIEVYRSSPNNVEVFIGAPGDDDAGSEAGAVYHYLGDGVEFVYSEVSKIIDFGVGDAAGHVIAFDPANQTLVVGLETAEKVAVFSSGILVGTIAMNNFTAGGSTAIRSGWVDISDRYIAVGLPEQDNATGGEGEIFFFDGDPSTLDSPIHSIGGVDADFGTTVVVLDDSIDHLIWSQPNSNSGDGDVYFGEILDVEPPLPDLPNGLDVDGGWAAFGDPNADTVAVARFDTETGAWVESQIIGNEPESGFGAAIGMDGPVMAVGAPGANGLDGRVLIYVRDAAGIYQFITQEEGSLEDGLLGYSVDVREDLVVAGAPAIDGFDPGSVAAYNLDPVDYTIQASFNFSAGNESDLEFGAAVAVANNEEFWVGVPGNESGEGRVAHYVLTEGGGEVGPEWDEDLFAELSPSVSGAAGRFGASVATDDGRVVVGQPGNGNGLLWHYPDAATTPSDVETITPPGGDSGFGTDVAASGDIVAVGSGGTNRMAIFSDLKFGTELELVENLAGFESSGTVSVAADGQHQLVTLASPTGGTTDELLENTRRFSTLSRGIGDPGQKLYASDGSENDRFGDSVTVVGDTMIVASPDARVAPTGSGSIEIFNRIEGQWTGVQTIKGGAIDVAFDGETLAVLGDDQVTTYRQPGPGQPFTQVDSEAAEDAIYLDLSPIYLVVGTGSLVTAFSNSGGTLALLGDVSVDHVSLAAARDNFVVGEPDMSTAGFGGRITVFALPNLNFVDEIFNERNGFGTAVDMTANPDRVAVGGNGNLTVYQLDEEGYVIELEAVAGTSPSNFGYNLALEPDRLAVARIADTEPDTGAQQLEASVLYWTYNNGAWENVLGIQQPNQQQDFSATGIDQDQFGSALSISGDQLVIGAPEEDEAGENAGAAFVFNVPEPVGPVGPTGLTVEVTSSAASVPVGTSAVATAALPPQATEGYGGGNQGIADTSLSTVDASDPENELLSETSVDDLELTGQFLQTVLLSDIPIEGGWGALLAGTPFQNIPVQNITLGDVIDAGILDGVPIERLDLSATPVGAIPVGAIAIGDTPVGAIELPSGQTVCQLARELVPGVICLNSDSLIDLGIRGVPVGAIPVGAIPVGAIDIAGTPVGAIPVGAIDLAGTPVGAIPVGAIDLAQTPVGAIPVGAIPVGAIPVGAIPVGAIGLAVVVDGGAPIEDRTLGDLDTTGIAGTPVGAIDISEAPVGAIDIRTLPVGAIPVGAINLAAVPVGAIPVGAIQVNGSPVGAIPVGAIDVAGSPVGAIPVGAIDLAVAPVGAIPVGAIDVGSIPVGAIPVGAIPVGAIRLVDIDLDSSPVGAIPVGAIPVGAIGALVDCSLIDCGGDATLADAVAAGALLLTGTIGDLEGLDTGVRLSDLIGIDGLTEEDIVAQLAPFAALLLRDFLTFDDLTLAELPQNHPQYVQTLLAQLGPDALNLISLQALVDGLDSLTIDELRNQLAGLTLADLLNLTGMTLEDIIPSPPTEAFSGQTLAAILPYMTSVRLGDLLALLPGVELDFGDSNLAEIDQALWADITLEELANYGGTTLEQLIANLDAETLANLSLGDLLLSLLGIDNYDWAELDLGSLDLPPAASVTVETSFIVTGATSSVRLQVILPPNSDFVKGSAFLTDDLEVGSAAIGAAAVTGLNAPIVSGNQLEFRLGNIEPDITYTLSLETTTGLTLGNRAIESRGRVAGTNIQSGQKASLAVVEAFEPNDVTADAIAAVTDTIYISHLSSADDVDVYSIELEEGARLALSLSDLPADYDLAVFGPTEEAPLVPLGDQEIVPTEPPRGVGFAGSQNSNKPSSLADLPRQGDLPIISVSNRSGTETEIIDIASVRRAGTYYIQVSGHSDAFSAKPYGLFVNAVAPPAPIVCQAQDFASPANRGSVPTAAEMAGVNTLILTSQERLFAKYGADANTAVSAMNDLVTYLDGNPDLGLKAAVVSVEGDADVLSALAALDGEACDPNTVNGAVREIAALIAELRAADPATEISNIIVVGDDDVLPFARLQDDTTIANETSFSWTFIGDDPLEANSLFGVADGGFYLSDEPYGDLDPIRSGNRTLFLSDTALGRVVETPAEIAGQIATFIAFDGTLSPATGFVSGYDFLDDGAEAVAAALNALPDIDPVDQLITETWTKDNLDSALFPDGESPGVAAINAHFDQYRALPADQSAAGQEDDLFTTAEINQAGRVDDLIGRILFSMGCHGGLSVPDQLFEDLDPRAADWAQTFGRQRAVWVANTGYGYGETEGVELTERLMELFAERLDGRISVGEALLYAKQTYLGTRQAEYGPFDEKVLQQSTFYGLPIYRVGVAEVPAPEPVPSLPDLAPLSGTELEVDTIVSDPSFERNENEGGSSFDASLASEDSGTTRRQATPFSPILPTVSYDVSAVEPDGRTPVAIAQGAFITELRSRDVVGVEPDIAKPIVDLIGNEREPEVGKVGTEPTVFVSNYRTPEGPRQQLSALAATFQSTAQDGTGTTRLFEEVEFEVFYRQPGSSADQQAPIFRGITSLVQLVPGTGRAILVIKARVDDPSGVERVLALVAEDPDADTTWTPVELTQQGPQLWSGAVEITGSNIEFIMQALDGNGNVALSTNKTKSYLDNDQPDEVSEEIATSVDRDPDAGGFYTASVTVSASAGGQEIQYRVNNGPLVDGGTEAAVPLDPAELGDGAVTVTFVLANGEQQSITVLFDTQGPTISLSPDEGGEVRSPVTVQYSCGDAASGTAQCNGSIDGDPVADGAAVELPVGQHTLAVSAADALGNQASRSVTFAVIPPLTPDDSDGDGVPDVDDNCVDDSNPGQEDGDGDGIGNACDPNPDDGPDADPDDDGLTNAEEAQLGTDPNDPDSDNDGINDGDEVAAGTDPNDPDDPGIECTISGTNRNDVLWGTNGPDVICGFGGNDRIYGFGGDDVLIGGDGNDLMIGGSGADMMDGGNGRDIMRGNAGEDEMEGGAGNDILFGGGHNDVIRGGIGHDLISGGSLDDLIYGDDGRDRILGGTGDDTAYGGNGNDSMVGSAGDDIFFGGDGHDHLSGGQGADILNGEGGDDVLLGQNGNDELDGGDGRDRCRGGRGIDIEIGCEL